MAGRYSQIFTLKDIFNNVNLKGKLPLINYKETMLENGKISKRTNVKSFLPLCLQIFHILKILFAYKSKQKASFTDLFCAFSSKYNSFESL